MMMESSTSWQLEATIWIHPESLVEIMSCCPEETAVIRGLPVRVHHDEGNTVPGRLEQGVVHETSP